MILDVDLLKHIYNFMSENKINLKKIHLLELRCFFDRKKLSSVSMNGLYGLEYTYYIPKNEARIIYKYITETLKIIKYSNKKNSKRNFVKVYNIWEYKNKLYLNSDIGMFLFEEEKFIKLNYNFKIKEKQPILNDSEIDDLKKWIKNKKFLKKY